MLNFPPFYEGQRVVALVTIRNVEGALLYSEGDERTVYGQTQCCGVWYVDIGIKIPDDMVTICILSCKQEINPAGIQFCYASHFTSLLKMPPEMKFDKIEEEDFVYA